MSEATLQAISALNGFFLTVEDTTLSEVTPLTIVSIATPKGGRNLLHAQLEKTLGLDLPDTGKISRSGGDSALFGLQDDQCFLVSLNDQPDPANLLKRDLGDAAYLSDQSDSWVALEINGALSRRALERVCPLDLAEGVFTEQHVARTSMEHLSVIIEHPSSDVFRLYSPRSSAISFRHALTQSLHNVSEQ